MAAQATSQSTENRPPSADRIRRFDLVERSLHWVVALMVLTLVFTGAVIYVPALEGWIGRRGLMFKIHFWVGVTLPGPLFLSMVGRWGRGVRADMRRLNRYSQEELQWLRTFGRWGKAGVGKFNPGQKLNAAAVGGLLAALLLTGLVLRWPGPFPPSWSTGATFVHEVFAFALAALILGHVAMALTHPGALRSMIKGWVRLDWVRRHAPAWEVPGNERPAAAPGKAPLARVAAPAARASNPAARASNPGARASNPAARASNPGGAAVPWTPPEERPKPPSSGRS
jgi:formate dehydrogenase subunit gamma